jgi:CheY-like chemotaxis protein
MVGNVEHSGPRRRVLVADDDPIVRLDLRQILERVGFEVCAEARDGEEAVALAFSERPHVALLDVGMPKLDGLEAVQRILADRPLPIVMLTGHSDGDVVARAVELGVFGYLVKPFREQDVVPTILTALSRFADARRAGTRFDVVG